jgi:hypothetical protein
MCGGACYINIILSFIILVVIIYIEENILRSDTTEIILENKNIFLTKKRFHSTATENRASASLFVLQKRASSLIEDNGPHLILGRTPTDHKKLL